jgi:hypothetical protein
MSGKRSSRKRRPAQGPPAKAPADTGSPAKDPPAKAPAEKRPPATGPRAKAPAEKRPPATGPRAKAPAERRPPAKGESAKPAVAEIPPRMVGIAYVLALLCLVTPLTVLGSGFAGAVLFTRGMRREGAGVIVVSVVCVALGFFLRTQ